MSISIELSKGLNIDLDLSISTIDKKIKLVSATNNGTHLIWVFENAIITDEIINNGNFLHIKRNIEILKEEEYSFSFKIFTNINDPEVFIPGVMFKENKAGSGCYPKLSYSKSWSFDETRMNIPGCISIFNKKKIFIASTRSNKLKQSTSFMLSNITYRLPSEEWPSTYNGKNIAYFSNERQNTTYKTLKKGEVINTEYLLYFKDSETENETKYIHLFNCYKEFASHFVDFHQQDNSKYISWWDYKALLLVGLLKLVHRDTDGTYIKMGIGNGIYQQYYNYTSGSFLVKSLEAACVFAKLDIKYLKANVSANILKILEETENLIIPMYDYKELAKEIADFFLKAEKPKGIFRDTYNYNSKEWTSYYNKNSIKEYRYAVNTRSCGEAMLSYLKLCSIFSTENTDKYLQLIERVVDFFIDHQKDNGNYGRWFDEKGNLLNDLGCNGSHILRLLITLYVKTNNSKYLNSIKKAIPYYSKMIQRGYYFGDTLDANCMDKESGIILLNSFIHLYEIPEFHEPYILELCKDAANYITTWVVLDDIQFKENTPLGKRKFKSIGYSSVSISNAHLDLYGMQIAYDFIKLSKISTDKFYEKIAKLMINACRKLISNPNDLLEKSKEYYGWVPEQINHTHWDYFNNPTHIDGYFNINIAWTQILLLDNLEKIQTNFKEIMESLC